MVAGNGEDAGVRWIFLLMVMAATSKSALAADERGMFVTGGGMGSVSCPELVDGMALVRQRGGIKSPQGAQATNEFKQYVRGFRTGYNMAAPKVSDAFASLGDDVVAKSICLHRQLVYQTSRRDLRPWAIGIGEDLEGQRQE